jgi:hypothetical protein
MATRFSVEAIFKAVDRMSAPVAKMQTRLGRMTKSMEASLRRVNARITGIAKGVGGMAARVAKAGVGMAAGLGGGLMMALQKTADKADALAKQSRRLDFPIEALQEWKFVAEQSGVSSGLLDKSLGAFTKRLGEAKAGTGPLVAGLKNLNPQLLKQLKGTDSVADAFDIYIKAIRGAGSATEKAALANAAFSRAGIDLVNISHNSAEAIAALRQEQRENGVITQAQAEAAEAYNDAMASLKRSMTGIIDQVLLPMMPAITRLLKEWRAWIVENKHLIKAKIKEYLIDVKNAFLKVRDNVRKVTEFMDEHGSTVGRVALVVASLVFGLKILIGVLTVVNILLAANPIVWIIVAILALIAAIALAVIYWDDIKAAFRDFGKMIGGWFLKQWDKAVGIFDALKEKAAPLMDVWDEVKTFFKDLWTDIVGAFEWAEGKITALIDKIMKPVDSVINAVTTFGGKVRDFVGLGGDEGEGGAAAVNPEIVSPGDRTARKIEETRATSTAEVTIRDQTGRAEVTRGKLGGGVHLQRTGTFGTGYGVGGAR